MCVVEDPSIAWNQKLMPLSNCVSAALCAMVPLLLLRQSSASTSLVKQAVEHTLQEGKLNILVLNDEDRIAFDWHRLQKFLCAIYVAQLNVAYAGGVPLFDCNVVFDKWCGYDFSLEKDVGTVYVSSQGKKKKRLG